MRPGPAPSRCGSDSESQTHPEGDSGAPRRQCWVVFSSGWDDPGDQPTQLRTDVTDKLGSPAGRPHASNNASARSKRQRAYWHWQFKRRSVPSVRSSSQGLDLGLGGSSATHPQCWHRAGVRVAPTDTGECHWQCRTQRSAGSLQVSLNSITEGT